MACHRLGVAGLVVAALVEADREGLHLARRLRLHQRHHGGGIDSPGQERPERHVRHHPRPHAVSEDIFQFRRGFAFVHERTRGDRAAQPPIGRDARLRAGLHGEDGAGRELVHIAKNRRGAGHVAVAHECRDGLAIDLAAPRRVCHQRLEFGAEQQHAAAPAPVQRLDAEPIANQPQRRLGTIPQRDGEHADEPRHRALRPKFPECRQHHLGIRAAAKPVAKPREFVAQLGEIIDLAVVGDDIASVRGMHRLMPERRQIDDRQPPMPKPDAGGGIDEDAGIIRPAVRHRVGHGPRGGLRRFGRGRPVRVEETRYAAQINNLRPFNAPPRRRPHLPNTPMLYSQRRRSWHRRGTRISLSPSLFAMGRGLG